MSQPAAIYYFTVTFLKSTAWDMHGPGWLKIGIDLEVTMVNAVPKGGFVYVYNASMTSLLLDFDDFVYT